MQIEKKLNGTELTLNVSGRLDTLTAPELDDVIKASTDDITSLTLDFANLEYVSSAGLRVLLSAQKKMNTKGTMVICNANDTIKEVFDVTGFSDILTIQ